MTAAVLVIFDDEGVRVQLNDHEASTLLALTRDLEAATVSACPTCRSRVLAAVALVDVLTGAPPFDRAGELVVLADDAPTLHLYLRDVATSCRHASWRDPGFAEWSEVMDDLVDHHDAIS